MKLLKFAIFSIRLINRIRIWTPWQYVYTHSTNHKHKHTHESKIIKSITIRLRNKQINNKISPINRSNTWIKYAIQSSYIIIIYNNNSSRFHPFHSIYQYQIQYMIFLMDLLMHLQNMYFYYNKTKTNQINWNYSHYLTCKLRNNFNLQ